MFTIQDDINSPINIYQGPGELSVDDFKTVGTIKLGYTFGRRFGLSFEYNGLSTKQLVKLGNRDYAAAMIDIPALNMSFRASINRTSVGGSPEISGSLIKPDFRDSDKRIDTLCFSVFNFPDVFAKTIIIRNNQPVEIILFSNETFEIELTPISNLHKVYEALKESRGHLITYTGILRKKDGSEFDISECEQALDALRNTLSFSQGRDIDINFQTGLLRGSPQLQRYSTTFNSPVDSRVTWFDTSEPRALNSVFEGMERLLRNEVWTKEINKVLHWYFTSLGDHPLEVSIVLNQTALDLLIWCYFVEDKKLFPAKFGKLDFYSRLKELHTLIANPNVKFDPRVDLELYGERRYPGKNWLELFVTVRNSIVHPDRKYDVETEGFRALYNTQQIGFQMLELAILRLCKFKGKAKLSMDKPQMLGKVVELDYTESTTI